MTLDDSEGWPGIRGIYRRHDGVRDWWERFLEVWESVEVVIEEATEGPDGRVLLQVAGTFRGGASGVETDVRAWEVLRIADGKVARRTLAWSKEDGRAAAGLPAG